MKQITLITGASHGIGKALATRFAMDHQTLVLNSYTDSHALHKLAADLESQWACSCLVMQGDIGDPDFVRSLFSKVKDEYGPVTRLINNAGISEVGLLSELSDSAWNRILSTNLSSVFYTCREAIPDMVAMKQGKIINISSVWGLVGASCEAAYSATKGGVNAFTKALAKELAPSQIQVNAIACGVIDTRMNALFSPEEKEDLTMEIPAGRFGTPQEVAELAYDLASSHPYLTGQIITLDGGWI